jgi:hypothetical protein
MKFLACHMALVGLVLCIVVTPSHARSIRADNPNSSGCDLYYFQLSSDIYSSMNGNADGLQNPTTFFYPGFAVGESAIFCEPLPIYNNGNLLSLWTSPLQSDPSSGLLESTLDPANPASQPLASPPGAADSVGLPTNTTYIATSAFLYQWRHDTSVPPEAEVMVWTLPTGDLEFEFDGWCPSASGTASFTWMGNFYTASCGTFAGDDLLINQYSGLPDGYVISSTDPTTNNTTVFSPSPDWQVVYATFTTLYSLTNPLNANPPIVLQVRVTDTGNNSIQVGNVELMNGTNVLSISPVSAGMATFNMAALPTGIYAYTAVYEGVPSQTLPSSAPINFAVDPPPPTVAISVAPTTIVLGQSAKLTWSSTNSTTCTASGTWSGTEAGSGSIQVTPTSTGSLPYTLTCINASTITNTSTSTAITSTLTVNAVPPMITVTVTPGAITVGQSATLTWSSTNASSCIADSAWSGTQATSGTLTLDPTTAGGFAYSLTCTGAGGTGNGAAALIVSPTQSPPGNPPTVKVTISPSTITVGQSATLTWSSTNATSCTADSAWSGAQAMSGTLTVTPTAVGGYAYSLSCSGAAGTGNGAVGLSVIPVTVTPPAPAPSKSGGGSVGLWELLALGGLLSLRLKRGTLKPALST